MNILSMMNLTIKKIPIMAKRYCMINNVLDMSEFWKMSKTGEL